MDFDAFALDAPPGGVYLSILEAASASRPVLKHGPTSRSPVNRAKILWQPG